MIVADTGAIVALIDADDAHHRKLLAIYEADPGAWVLPWAVLAEIDHLLLKLLGLDVQLDFVRDVADGAWSVEHGVPADLERAAELCQNYRDLELGMVDAVVAAVAERLGASHIATLDERDFGVLELKGSPRLLPRDG